MANPTVIAWLKRTASSEAAHSLLFAAGCLVLAGFLVILHPEWRGSLAGCAGAGDAPEANSAPTLPLEALGANHAEVLGLPANASFEEVESGYRRRLRVVVPHKVADPELRELAEEQRSAIQAAYENFLEQHKTRQEPTPARSVERLWEEQRASHRDLQG